MEGRETKGNTQKKEQQASHQGSEQQQASSQGSEQQLQQQQQHQQRQQASSQGSKQQQASNQPPDNPVDDDRMSLPSPVSDRELCFSPGFFGEIQESQDPWA